MQSIPSRLQISNARAARSGLIFRAHCDRRSGLFWLGRGGGFEMNSLSRGGEFLKLVGNVGCISDRELKVVETY